MEEPRTREARKWWYVGTVCVQEVTGYDCKPHNPDTWWCPEVGVSATEGHHLFSTKREALNKAIEEAAVKADKANRALAALTAQL